MSAQNPRRVVLMEYFHTLLISPASGGALAGYGTARLLKR